MENLKGTQSAVEPGADELGNRSFGIQQDDFAASLEEVEKMDAILKMKITEEKRAKLSRIQEEEESRDILRKLPCPKTPKSIKINLEEFIKVLNEAEKAGEDTSPCLKLNEGGGLNGKEEDEKGKRSVLPFVERNILLAKCGRGTLSLTDEEKTRIEHLLVDLEESSSKTVASAPEKSKPCSDDKDFYAVDPTIQSTLSEIDERLEGLKKLRRLFPEVRESEDNIAEEGVKQDRKKEEKNKKKKGSRLEEINKLLNSMSSTSEEEIHPLSEEELGRLIRQSGQNLSHHESDPPEGKDVWQNCKPPQDVISELVSEAKLLMPKFKYRFNDV